MDGYISLVILYMCVCVCVCVCTRKRFIQEKELYCRIFIKIISKKKSGPKTDLHYLSYIYIIYITSVIYFSKDLISLRASGSSWQSQFLSKDNRSKREEKTYLSSQPCKPQKNLMPNVYLMPKLQSIYTKLVLSHS
jgi:hypothetical protein